MSKKKKSKKNYKQYTITTVENGAVALGSLLSAVASNLKKYKEYAVEIDELLEKYKSDFSDDANEVLIPATEYDAINDKLLYRQRELLKYISDSQKSSLSYYDLRKLLLRCSYLTEPLNEEISAILNELLDVRNWTFHNPQSMLVANAEVSKKSIPKEWEGLIKVQPQLNPLIITHISHYDLLMLISLSVHAQRRIEQFELILAQMKADYKKLYQQIENTPFVFNGNQLTRDATFFERNFTQRFADFSADVTQISMAIQKSKYDGTTEVYNKWAINKSDSVDEEETEEVNQE